MSIVVDAGAVVDLLLQRPAASRVRAVLEREPDDLHAPELMDLEVLSALRRLRTGGELTLARADQALEDLQALPVLRHGHRVLVPRIWALRENVSPYDAAYLALAEGLGDDTVLVTLDARLGRAATVRSAVRTVVP